MLKTNLKPLALSAMFVVALSAGASRAMSDESGIVMKQASADDSSYCHIKYMAFNTQTLRSAEPEFNPADIVDRYGSCDFNPRSHEEIQNQRRDFADREYSPRVGGDSND